MGLVLQLAALASRIATEIKALVRPEHPGLARAWVNFGYVGGSLQIRSVCNVSTVTRLATGRYRIVFATPFADTAYCWLALARSPVNSGNARFALIRSTTEAKTAAYVDIACGTSSGTLSDSTEMNVVVFR